MKKASRARIKKGQKPTIEELERILDQEEEVSIEILPNGEIREKGRKTRKKPLTMREDLGGEYFVLETGG